MTSLVLDLKLTDKTAKCLREKSAGKPEELVATLLEFWSQAESIEEYRRDRATLEEEERFLDRIVKRSGV